MSEYWVSKKKYYCRYCEFYIADDVPSRQQHENGLRHKGNTERFIRGLYKSSEKRKKEQEDEKREMARVERAAQAAFAQDVGTGLARPSSSHGAAVASSSAAPAPRKSSAKPANPYANYTTAASLGIKDPDLERLAAEAERRRTQGVAGEWEVVTPVSQPDAEESEAINSNSGEPETSTSLKREADGGADDEDDGPRFKLRKKTLGSGLGGIYDPGIIQIKSKKEEPVESTVATVPAEQLKQAGAPKWTKVQWTTTADAVNVEPVAGSANGPSVDTQPLLEPTIKAEPEGSPSDEDNKDGIIPKREISPSAPPISNNLFRKRKVPTGATRGKRPM